MLPKDQSLRWGILGTGKIAHAFAWALATSNTGRLVAVASRSGERGRRFGETFGLCRVHDDYGALLVDPEVDAVYVATPHPSHARLSIQAARAHKHVLCEKPLGLNHAEAMAVFEAAREYDVLVMEAFMYRCHPQTERLVELVRQGTIGRVRTIQATFSFQAAFDPASRLFDPELGGGGILDVGCYPVSMARLVAGAATGVELAEPTAVVGLGVLGESGVDEGSSAVLKFPDGILATVSTGLGVDQDNVVQVFGTEGSIFVPRPWMPERGGSTAELHVRRKAQPPEVLCIASERSVYALEADRFAEGVPDRRVRYPGMTPTDSLGNAQTLDRWRRAIGLVYPSETTERAVPTVSGLPLERRPASPMAYGRLAGLSLPVARLVMGSPEQGMTHAAVLFDDYFERGGNVFDTALVYEQGRQEKQLGNWVRSRGIRGEVVLITKGGHTPYCTPRDLSRQMEQSLEHLGVEHVDVYLLHRDNLDVPVGEFIDVLNQHFRAGRMKLFGASNWTRARMDQANAYAAQHGLEPLRVLSNNLSLARMVREPWPGCLACSDPEWQEWLTQRQMPVLAWSSQARGFFGPRARPDPSDDEPLVKAWYADDNFERQRRTVALAVERGVSANSIALAYVLARPFPIFALIGPKTPQETRSSLEALTLRLSPADLRWLNLESPR